MVTEFAKEMIKNADSCGAQDIYVIPRQDNYELYMRVGQERRLIDVYRPDFMASLIGHFKFVAGMMVGEKRRSQLGSCDYDCGDGQRVSLRLSTVGDYRGLESLVIRVLHSERRELVYWNQGIQPIMDALDYRGLYLFAGPVGSGKTTLMHELVQERFKGQQVISIEDPVEIKQDNVLQLQVNQAIDMTYDNLIKLSLRHRPDVLIIGEIRDKETARAVIRASLTGVTVLSTIHAKSVAGVYERLLDLGVDKSELDNALQGITYMRLIKGGGVIDFASENFQSHSSTSWNQQLEGLVQQGHLTSISLMKASLMRGDRLDQMFASVGFSDNIVTQIALADKHGNLLGSLTKIETYMLRMTKVRKKLMEVATYPILLLGFLILIMLGLKNYLLPQLLEGDGKDNWAVQLVQIFPQLFFVSLCGLLVLSLILYLWVRHQPALVFYRRMAKIPFIGQTVRLYTTAYYAREWGNLLGQGIDLLDLVALMKEQKSKLFRELGADLEKALMLGQSFPDRIASHPFFTKELSLIIAYGEANARLGYELEVYAEEVWQAFFNRLNKATTFVQPLIFVIVAVVIVMIYAAMLLPMYQNMEGMMS